MDFACLPHKIIISGHSDIFISQPNGKMNVVFIGRPQCLIGQKIYIISSTSCGGSKLWHLRACFSRRKININRAQIIKHNNGRKCNNLREDFDFNTLLCLCPRNEAVLAAKL